jgi:hypothetical protein
MFSKERRRSFNEGLSTFQQSLCPNEAVSTLELKKNESVQRSKYFRKEKFCCCPLAYQQNELGFTSEIISEAFFNQKKISDFLLKKGGFGNRI